MCGFWGGRCDHKYTSGAVECAFFPCVCSSSVSVMDTDKETKSASLLLLSFLVPLGFFSLLGLLLLFQIEKHSEPFIQVTVLPQGSPFLIPKEEVQAW